MSNSPGTPRRRKERTSKSCLQFRAQSQAYEQKAELLESKLHANTFTYLPTYESPSEDLKRVPAVNPFNGQLKERLEKHTFSPTVFSTVFSPGKDIGEFRWTIEDLASMKPANIEASPNNLVEVIDSETESQAQESIERYFSSTHMPSPVDMSWAYSTHLITPDPKRRSSLVIASSSTPRRESSEKRPKFDVGVQTALSLPPVLPEEVEAILKPYFKFNQDEVDENNLSSSSLRRKLFFHREDEQISPVRESSVSPVVRVGSPSSDTRSSHNVYARVWSPPDEGAAAVPDLPPCDVSPIRRSTVSSGDPPTNHFDFSANMVVDSSQSECLSSTGGVVTGNGWANISVGDSITCGESAKEDLFVTSSSRIEKIPVQVSQSREHPTPERNIKLSTESIDSAFIFSSTVIPSHDTGYSTMLENITANQADTGFLPKLASSHSDIYLTASTPTKIGSENIF